MPVYRYNAIAPNSGSRRRGELTADTASQVRSALRTMGLAPTRVTLVRERVQRSNSESPNALTKILNAPRRLQQSPARKRDSLIEFYESLAALLNTGTPLVQGLELLAGHDGARSRRGRALASMCRGLADRVSAGDTLADAMADRRDWFAPVDLALVRSSTESGQADRTLTDLAEAHARSGELQGSIASAMAYPMLLTVFGIGAVVFLSTKTLPQLAGVLLDAGVELPLPTSILLTLGQSLSGHPLLWMSALIAVAMLAAWLWATPVLSRARLRLPVFGPAVLKSQLGTASLLLARLIEGGVPLCDAVALTAPTVRNSAIRDELAAIGDAVREGRSASDSLLVGGVADPVFCRVISVGEESGELAHALETIGVRHMASSARLTQKLAAILEPTVILILAAMIGFVVYAAIIPMLRVSQTF